MTGEIMATAGMSVDSPKVQYHSWSNLVTKDDLEIKLSPIRADLQLLKWMMGVMLAGILSLILKSFF